MQFIALLFAVLLPAAASAGDYADFSVIGFSPDGKYFAFIEHGVQDGSGFPYANGYVIDTQIDEWVDGTPVRVLVDEEAASDAIAYVKAATGLSPLIKKLGLHAPATAVASNPITELSADPHSVSFVPVMMTPPDTSGGYMLTLTESALPAPDCPQMPDPFVGFRLVLTPPSGAPRTLHADTGPLPSSRKCPTGYGISAVLFDPDRQAMAVMIDVFSVGFEGPDRRFIAVTTPFE